MNTARIPLNRSLLLQRFALVMLALGAGPIAQGAGPSDGQLEFFEKRVRPLLVEHCFECHSAKAKKLRAGLLMDSRVGLSRGGDSGSALGEDADDSLLIEAVRYESYEMPPKGKLPEQDIASLEAWVNMGAPWPDEPAPTGGATLDVFDLQTRKANHWVWRAMKSQTPPTVQNESWVRNDLDRFILARLEAADLQPSPPTDRHSLVRRLYFDLVGLPPTPDQVSAFTRDERPDAIERLVEELLDSSHFGERWGRHWLDLVRYAESRGHEFDNDSPGAYQYRDYVIRAFNVDLPYDQFVREHIAGDLLDPPRLNAHQGFNESILGTGFWFLGEWVHSPVDIRKDETDRFDNMIDVMSKTFLGVTVSCARCHDHKFDAISTADYYSLAGFLQSSDYRQVRFETIEHNRHIATQLAKLDQTFRSKIGKQLAALSVQQVAVPSEEAAVNEIMAAHVAVDFSGFEPREIMQNGFLFGSRSRLAGEPWIEEAGETTVLRFAERSATISDSFWDGLKTLESKAVQSRSRLSKLPRSGRMLRSPTFTLKHGNVVCRVLGRGHVVACVDSHRLIAGPLHGETVREIKPDERWVRLDLSRYVGHRIHLEFTPAVDAQLQVSLVLQGATPSELKHFEQRESEIEEAVQQHAQIVALRISEDSDGANRINKLVQAWGQQHANLKSQVQHTSHLAMAMMDGSGENEHLLIRGSSSNPGIEVPRRFLTAITGDQPLAIRSGSGRLQLAEKINSPANPLTSRVIVNRVWHHLMGRGIVPTTDDFGVLGQRPTHPELLDHLALRFLADGRSIKRMIRYVVLSQTYQMSSDVGPDALAADPKNGLWHHRPLQRLEGEAIRDALLAISGRLDESAFGEPVPIHLTPFMEGRGRPGKSGPRDGDGRRSIYIAVRRNFLSPFMLTFDTPAPFSTMGRRNVSNVPAQSLILMNDPFVVQQAKSWAGRALQVVPQSKNLAATEKRIDWMYNAAFARSPSDRELRSAIEFLFDQKAGDNMGHGGVQGWADFAHALINTKEFIFLR